MDRRETAIGRSELFVNITVQKQCSFPGFSDADNERNFTRNETSRRLCLCAVADQFLYSHSPHDWLGIDVRGEIRCWSQLKQDSKPITSLAASILISVCSLTCSCSATSCEVILDEFSVFTSCSSSNNEPWAVCSNLACKTHWLRCYSTLPLT